MTKFEKSPFCHNPNQTDSKTNGRPYVPTAPALIVVVTIMLNDSAVHTFAAPPHEGIIFPPHQHQAGSYDLL